VTSRHEETEEERADRNFGDILQELRVSETGVQILFSLLLTVPFAARFPEITDFQRRVYFTALMLAASANVVLIAPVAYHRMLFARGEKPRVVRWSSRLALVGLVLLVLAVMAVLLLISDVLFATTAAAVVAVGFGSLTALLWFGPPLASLASGRGRRGPGGVAHRVPEQHGPG
jgi:small-conductance mechanosensitive channel